MNSPSRIGIVGGGQLGKMMVMAAKKLGFYVIVTDPTPNSPAGQVADKQIIGGYKDAKTTRELAKLSDVITVDAEFVNDVVLEIISKKKPVHPNPKTLTIIKDKLKQKQFLRLYKIPTAAFTQIESRKNIEDAAKLFGYPLLLKARLDAYDGKGNFVLKNRNDIDKGLKKLEGRKLYIEQFVPFVKELAIMVVRGMDGKIITYEVVETLQKDNVCDTVIVPAPISKIAKKRAKQLAIKTVKHLKGAGVFGIEMFIKIDDNVLVNEIAPRVHNSGHYTIEGAATSQFEQHIRAITNLPLGSTQLLARAIVMKNILGTRNGSGFPLGLEKALKISGVSVHIYGKNESRPGRKMGHITVVGNSVAECLRKANKARRALVI